MAKEKERKVAQTLYIDQGLTAKQIAQMLGVTEDTIGTWVEKYGWKKARNAKITAPQNREQNIYEIIDNLAQDRISLFREIQELGMNLTPENRDLIKEKRQTIAQIDNGVSQWSKTLATIKRDNTVNQLTLIQSMYIIFKHFDTKYPELAAKSVEFQEYFLNEVATTY